MASLQVQRGAQHRAGSCHHGTREATHPWRVPSTGPPRGMGPGKALSDPLRSRCAHLPPPGRHQAPPEPPAGPERLVPGATGPLVAFDDRGTIALIIPTRLWAGVPPCVSKDVGDALPRARAPVTMARPSACGEPGRGGTGCWSERPAGWFSA